MFFNNKKDSYPSSWYMSRQVSKETFLVKILVCKFFFGKQPLHKAAFMVSCILMWWSIPSFLKTNAEVSPCFSCLILYSFNSPSSRSQISTSSWKTTHRYVEASFLYSMTVSVEISSSNLSNKVLNDFCWLDFLVYPPPPMTFN